MLKKADMHVHSIVSDGASTPEVLIEDALKENISALVLTDHDNIGGLKETATLAAKNNIKFLNGIEISSFFKIYYKKI